MKLFIAPLLCLPCLSGCGYSLQGSWKGGRDEQVKIQFRSDASVLQQGVKVEFLTWHGDYICLNTKKIRDAQAESLAERKKQLLDDREREKKGLLDAIERYKPTKDGFSDILESTLKSVEEEREKQLKQIEAQLEQVKNRKGVEWSGYFGMVVDKKDVSESGDKLEARIHWVDADHFDLGSTAFSRAKEND